MESDLAGLEDLEGPFRFLGAAKAVSVSLSQQSYITTH